MRILDIVLFLMLFSLATGLLESTGWFEGGKMPMEDLNITKAELEYLNASVQKVEGGSIGAVTRGASTIWSASIFMLNMMFRVVYVKDIIMGVFSVGLAPDSPDRAGINQIAWFVQSGIWFVYVVGIYQLWKGTSTANMQ